MEEFQKKKGNTGLIVLVIVLVILLLGSISYICYDKGVFDDLIRKEQPKPAEDPIKEELIVGNTFNLENISCVGTDTCEKTVKLSYNGVNHEIKLIKKMSNSTNYLIEVYVDGNLADTLDGGGFASWDNNVKVADHIKDLDGYIYVIDSKYLGIVYRVDASDSGTNWLLKFYDGVKPFENDKKLMVANKYSPLMQNGKTLTDLDALEFDGSSIKYWSWYCGNTIKPADDNDGTVVAQQHSVTFDGSNITNTIIKTIRDAQGGGQHECDAN